jgi:predicted nucleic acid-binding protein
VTKIDDALAGVTKLGIDTSPFIYFVERYPVYVDRVREIFRRIDAGAVAGYTSMLTVTEVLTQPKREGKHQVEADYRAMLYQSRHLDLLLIDATVAERAADLRAAYRLRTPDALQVAAALAAGCEAFLTNDAALQRVTELRVLVLDDLER